MSCIDTSRLYKEAPFSVVHYYLRHNILFHHNENLSNAQKRTLSTILNLVMILCLSRDRMLLSRFSRTFPLRTTSPMVHIKHRLVLPPRDAGPQPVRNTENNLTFQGVPSRKKTIGQPPAFSLDATQPAFELRAELFSRRSMLNEPDAKTNVTQLIL